MKTLKRILWVSFSLVLGLIILLAGSIAFDYWVGAERIGAVTNTTIPGQNGGPDVRAYIATPSGEGPFPVVIMIHEFFGLNESIVGKAEGLAQAGYLVVAPDTFRGSTTAWIPRAIYQVVTNRPEQVNQDLDSVYAWIEAQPNAAVDRVGVLGFCYGGRASLSYSLHNDQLAATVIFYGSPVTDSQALRSLPGPVLGIFGGADNSIPVEDVKAFETALIQAGIPNEITVYDGQPHAFVTDIESIRLGGVQGQAWAQMLAFLEQTLKQDADSQNPNPSQTYQDTLDWEYYLVVAFEHAFGTASQHSSHP
ncbi:MAG: dienelactone hydrolase family protein [Anaerolineales bacterium]|nr:dienelactone hydrolase family protein [Anaerolineales bacterium]